MQKLNQALKLWVKARRLKRSQRIFNELWLDPLSGMRDIIESTVTRRTSLGIMEWMNSARIIHCDVCPDTRQLRNHGAGKLCVRHYEMVEHSNGVPT